MRPLLAVAVANLVGGSTYAVTAAALKGFPEKELIVARMVVCAALFLPSVWTARRRLAALSLSDWLRLATVGLLGYALPLAMGTYGQKMSSATSASLLVGMEPVCIVMLSWAFLGERLTGLKVLALLLGLTGATLIAFQGPPRLAGAFTERLAGDLILVAHGFFWSLYSVVGKSALRRVRPLDFTAATTMFGLLGTLVWAAFGLDAGVFPRAPAAAWGAALYLAVMGGFAATWLWNWGLEQVDASRVANFVFVQPVVGVLLGTLVLGEPFTGWSAAGGALVAAGMWAATRS